MNKRIPNLPDYRVRVSRRARRASLRISPDLGLEVVVPEGFDHGRIPALLSTRADWISRQQQRFAGLRAEFPGSQAQTLVAGFHLALLDRDYRIRRREDGPNPRLLADASRLTLANTAARADLEAPLLQAWLKDLARVELPPRLEELATAHGFQYRRASIRLQRTRWGSCSSSGTISLNAALLFLSPHLVRHVLIHELCHTLQMDHSARFWSRVACLDPDCTRNRRELGQAWLRVPAWAGKRP